VTRQLSEPLRCYRIGDPMGAYPIFDATGSTLAPGRWNKKASPMLYTAEHYSTAMLEKLVHGSGSLPKNQHHLEITIPAGTSYEVFSEPHHPGWDSPTMSVARDFGHTWQQSKRSALLFVPSVVARMERNVLINLEHPDARLVRPGLEAPIWWDARLFPAPVVSSSRKRKPAKP